MKRNRIKKSAVLIGSVKNNRFNLTDIGEKDAIEARNNKINNTYNKMKKQSAKNAAIKALDELLNINEVKAENLTI